MLYFKRSPPSHKCNFNFLQCLIVLFYTLQEYNLGFVLEPGNKVKGQAFIILYKLARCLQFIE